MSLSLHLQPRRCLVRAAAKNVSTKGSTTTKGGSASTKGGDGAPGFKFDGSMQRWVRDDRFAGKSMTTVQPLRCKLAPSACTVAAELPAHLDLRSGWAARAAGGRFLIVVSLPASPQRHRLHCVAGHAHIPD